MKLLLTSSGLSNSSISKALFELVGKPASETSLVFIPTASAIETGDKDWLANDLLNIRKQGFKKLMITDISAVPENIWRPQLEEADVIWFEGGNTYYLMNWVKKVGLDKLLPELLKTRVYVGVSAGSMITNPDLGLKVSEIIYGDKKEEAELPALGFVDFYLLPHLNNEWFPKHIEDNVRAVASETKRKIYSLDDESALRVVDGKVEVISEGKYLELN